VTITLTYEPLLSRIKIQGSDLPDGFITVERSINQLLWRTVRGGRVVEVDSGNFLLYDYEFIDGVENFYRVGPAVIAQFTDVSADQTDGDPWTVPGGVNELVFEAWGAGGSGQGNTPPSTQHARPGGGGGSYSRSNLVVSGGETLMILVGEGGDKNGPK